MDNNYIIILLTLCLICTIYQYIGINVNNHVPIGNFYSEWGNNTNNQNDHVDILDFKLNNELLVLK